MSLSYLCFLWLWSSAWNLKSRPAISLTPQAIYSDVSLWWVLFLFPPLSPASLTCSADVTGLSSHILPSPPGQPVQHGAFLWDAQLVCLLTRQTDLLQRLQGGSARRHLPRPVLWRFVDTQIHTFEDTLRVNSKGLDLTRYQELLSIYLYLTVHLHKRQGQFGVLIPVRHCLKVFRAC